MTGTPRPAPQPADCPEYLTRPCLCGPACCPHCPHWPDCRAPQPGTTMNDAGPCDDLTACGHPLCAHCNPSGPGTTGGDWCDGETCPSGPLRHWRSGSCTTGTTGGDPT